MARAIAATKHKEHVPNARKRPPNPRVATEKTGGTKTTSGIAEQRMNRMNKAAIATKGRAGTAEDYGRYSTKSAAKAARTSKRKRAPSR